MISSFDKELGRLLLLYITTREYLEIKALFQSSNVLKNISPITHLQHCIANKSNKMFSLLFYQLNWISYSFPWSLYSLWCFVLLFIFWTSWCLFVKGMPPSYIPSFVFLIRTQISLFFPAPSFVPGALSPCAAIIECQFLLGVQGGLAFTTCRSGRSGVIMV